MVWFLIVVEFVNLHGSNGGAATTSTGLGEGPLGASGQVGLHLAELGKVEGGNLLGLLNLLLVGLDLALELVDESLHPLVVLPVLVLLVSQLLDVPLRLAQVLLGVSAPAVLSIHLRLELTNAGLHLCHSLLAALQGVLLSLINPVLGILDLSLQQLLVSLEGHC